MNIIKICNNATIYTFTNLFPMLLDDENLLFLDENFNGSGSGYIANIVNPNNITEFQNIILNNSTYKKQIDIIENKLKIPNTTVYPLFTIDHQSRVVTLFNSLNKKKRSLPIYCLYCEEQHN